MKNRYVLAVNVALIPLAALAAFVSRFDLGAAIHRPEFLPYVVAAVVIKPPIFLIVGMYRRYWRHMSIHDLAVVFWAVTISSMAMGLFVLWGLVPYDQSFSRIVLFNDWLITLAMVGGLRLTVRILGDARQGRGRGPGGSERRVLIAGAGSAGTMVLREMRRNPQLGMVPTGFLDDDPAKIGKYLNGLRVLGTMADLADLAGAHRIDHVVIAMPVASGSVVRRILDRCRELGLTSQTMPGVFELLGEQMSISRLRSVEIADLLRRAPVTSHADAAGEFLTGRVVLVTGAGGSIGSELARQVAALRPSRLVMLGHGENSLFDIEPIARRPRFRARRSTP